MSKKSSRKKQFFKRPVNKLKKEQEAFFKTVLNNKEFSTIPNKSDGTLDDNNEELEKEDAFVPMPKDKSYFNRFRLHVKDHWPAYAVSFIGFLILTFLFNFNGKLSVIDTAIEYQKDNVSSSANKIENISNDVSLLRERVLNDFSLFRGEIKSLSDRFDMFLEFYRREQ